MLKLLILGLVIYGIYRLFFKKDLNIKNYSKKFSKRNEEQKDAEVLVECANCKTYISSNEAFIKDGKYFCSKECMDAYNRS